MPAILAMILPALLPAVADGFKGLFNKFFGGYKPVNVDEQIKLLDADIRKLEALAKLDSPSDKISGWVADLRAAFRYVAAGIIILATIGLSIVYFWFCYSDPANAALAQVQAVLELFLQMAGSVFSFMFGDRLYLNLKGK